MDWSKKYTLLP